MELKAVISVLRNPFGFPSSVQKEARLQAASLLEEKIKKCSFYRYKEMHDFCYELSKDSLLTQAEFMALAKQLSRRGYSDGLIKTKLQETAFTWKVEPFVEKVVKG